MLLGAQTKYLMASHGDLETPLTKTKGSPHFLPILFIHLLDLLFLPSPRFRRRGKRTDQYQSGHLKKGSIFLSGALLLVWREKRIQAKWCHLWHRVLISLLLSGPVSTEMPSNAWLDNPIYKYKKKKVLPSHGGVLVRRGINQFTAYSAKANEVQWESWGYKVRSAILLPFSIGDNPVLLNTEYLC